MRETCFIGIPIRDGVFDTPMTADLALKIRKVKTPTSKQLPEMKLVVSKKEAAVSEVLLSDSFYRRGMK